MSFQLDRFQTLQDFHRDHIIDEVIRVEGGYVNNPNDRGGETKYGITRTTAESFRQLWPKHGFGGNMRDLPRSLAVEIYRLSYWDRNRCDQLASFHPLLAFHVFDMAVNGGSGLIGKQLQRVLNTLNRGAKDYRDIVVDGAIGNGTLDALLAYANRNGRKGVANLVTILVMMQGEFYISITEKRPANEVFTNGWVERASSKMRLFMKFLQPN